MWSAWGVQTETAPLTSGGSIPQDGQEHCFSSNTQLSLIMLWDFSQPHSVNCFCWWMKCGEGAGMFLTASSRRFELEDKMGATKLSIHPQKGYDGSTAKKQHARSVNRLWEKDPSVRDQVPEETSPHLLLGAQDQWLGIEQDQPHRGPKGTSPGNCLETETPTVRACHILRQPLQNHPSGHLGVWVTLWLAEEMLDG